MPESIVILGGGGHAAVVEAALLSSGKGVEAFLDDGLPLGSKVIEGEVKGKIADLASLKGKADKVHAAIGSNEARFTLLHKAKELGFTPETIVHPTAFVDPSAKLGEGVFVAAGAFIGPRAEIGDGVIINSKASVDHDCKVGSYSHICPGVILTGAVSVGPLTTVGAGSIVKPLVKIGANDLIGSGSIVVKNIGDNTVAFGSPAKAVKSNRRPKDPDARKLAPKMSDSAKRTLTIVIVSLIFATAFILLSIWRYDRVLAEFVHTPLRDKLQDLNLLGEISLICKKPYVTMLVAPFFVYFTFIRFNREWYRKLGYYLLSMGVCGVMSSLLKECFRRARPYNLFREAGHYGFFFYEQTKNAFKSFPSGHSMEVATMATVFWFIFPKLRPFFVVTAVLMMADRILMERHFLSDTIAGATVGIAIALLVKEFLAPIVLDLVEKLLKKARIAKD